MITGTLKNSVDRLWNIFWSGGIANTLDVIEQMTYLIFIRDLDDMDSIRSKDAIMCGTPHESIFGPDNEVCKWSVFRHMPAAEMCDTLQNRVFPFIKNLHGDRASSYSKYMEDAIFKIPTPLLLEQIVTEMDGINWRDGDIRGDIYEYLLSKMSSSGTIGQFRTPRHIIRMMVELAAPKPGDVICDPACGTAGFLVSAGEYLKERYLEEIFYSKDARAHYMERAFHGYDMDRTMLRIGAMNMITHGIENPDIQYKDSLSDQNPDSGEYSVILANPPFKGSLNYDIVSADLLKLARTKKTELLFLALFLRMLKVGGRCACIVPDGVLFGSSNAHRAIRREIIERNILNAVISMPSGVFKPYAGVSTAVLIFTKTGHGGTKDVWFYDMQADGFSLDDRRAPISESDIPDIVARYQNLGGERERARTEKSFLVPKDEIAANDYDLSINKYKKTVYIAEEYPSPREILTEIKEIEAEIIKGIAELEGMI